MEDPEQFLSWRTKALTGTAVRFRLNNDGDLPATNVRVQLALPDWLVPSRSDSLGDAYEGPAPPSFAFLHELMYEVKGRKGGEPSALNDLLRGMSVIGPPPSVLLGLGLTDLNAFRIDPQVPPSPKLEAL